MDYLRGGSLWFPASRMLALHLVILPGPPLEPALANLTAPPLQVPQPLQRGSAHTAFPGCPGPRHLAGAQNGHQDSRRPWPPERPGARGLLCLPVRVLLCGRRLCGFERLCQLLAVSWGEGTCWETDEAPELRRWPNWPSGYQETGP